APARACVGRGAVIGGGSIVNSGSNTAVPEAFTTRQRACATPGFGTAAVICVGESTVNCVPKPPKVTAVALSKFVPVSTTGVDSGACDADSDVIDGTGGRSTVNSVSNAPVP